MKLERAECLGTSLSPRPQVLKVPPPSMQGWYPAPGDPSPDWFLLLTTGGRPLFLT